MKLSQKGVISPHQYIFTEPGSILFLTGAPLSGKSTISPLVSISIFDCAIQHMDVVRLLAQEIESLKSIEEQNEFVHYGSTDAYTRIGEGTYTERNFIDGYIRYSHAVTRHFFSVLQKLSPEGINNMLIEGVQLTPESIAPYLALRPGLLIILTSTDYAFEERIKVRYQNEHIRSKYRPEMLNLIQQELQRQAEQIPSSKRLVMKNEGSPIEVANAITEELISHKIIVPR